MADSLKTIQRLDQLACDANALWHQIESFKMEIARGAGFSKEDLRKRHIYTGTKEVRDDRS